MDNYSCAKCRLTFSTKGNYTKHCLTKKHKRAGAEVVYECKKCNFSTTYKTRYEEHLLSYKCKYPNKIDKRKFMTMLGNYKKARKYYNQQLHFNKMLETTPYNELKYNYKEKLKTKSYIGKTADLLDTYNKRKDTFRPLMEQWLKLINLSINTRIKQYLTIWLSNY